MRIGIDCRTILDPENGERAGIGHYTNALVEYVTKTGGAHEFVLFFSSRNAAIGFEGGNVKTVVLPKKLLPLVHSHAVVPAVMKKSRLDVLHGPANIIPLTYKGKAVVTVHDLAIYKHPEWFPDGQDFSVKVAVPKSLARADRIIAVSEATKMDLQKQFGINEKKIDVVYEGVDLPKRVDESEIEVIKQKHGIKPRYIFFVGTIEPRKNLQQLIQGYDQMMLSRPERDRNISLVIAGGKGWKCDEIFSSINLAKFAHNIRYLGYISADEKQALLQGARCFAFPSLYEGFGLPMLEAMAAQTPVITSNVSAMPEVGGEAAIYVDPNNPESIAKGLAKGVFGRDHAQRVQLGRSLAKRFNWRQTAKNTIKVYEQLDS